MLTKPKVPSNITVYFRYATALLTFLFYVNFAHAEIKLPALITSGMVLQRDVAIPVWGWADPNETVTINFNGKVYKTKADADKKWKIKIDPLKAGGPYTLTISGTNKITLSDILIGDVWLCTGQSNMEFIMGNLKNKYPAEIAASDNPNIRHIGVKHIIGYIPAADMVTNDGWLKANPENVLKFTAVGYFFAKKLYEKYHVPIGLIQSTWGGTPAQTWTSTEGLKILPEYYKDAVRINDTANVAEIKRRDLNKIATWVSDLNKQDKGFQSSGKSWLSNDTDISTWTKIDMPGKWFSGDPAKTASIAWLKKEITLPASLAGKEAILELGSIVEKDTTYINGVKVGYSNSRSVARRYKVPAGLLHTGSNVITVRVVAPEKDAQFFNKPYQLTIGDGSPIDLKGEWKYQLAAIATPTPKPTNFWQWPSTLYNGMIAPILPVAIKGNIWYQGESNAAKAYEYRTLFPAMINDWRTKFAQGNFPFLFVQLANFMDPKPEPSEANWAELREAQSMTLSLPNTGMAVVHDIGEAKDIHPQNKKDVGIRLALAAEHLVYGDKKVVYSGPVYQSMRIKGNKIILSFTHIGGGLVARGGDLKYFAIAGADKKFVWATARIEGKTIVVSSPEVTAPVAVRYAWADNPEGCNLYNKEGLPASSFRTDTWPGNTAPKNLTGN